MKKIFKTVAFLLASAYAFAQAPQSFNYQGLARDNSGAAMATKTISVKATILDGTATGTSVYSETFSASTNAFGLFTLGIGSGTPVAGTFSAIKWSSGNKFLKIEIDPNGGSNYALSGTTQLLSVPYAMYAASSGDSKWTDATGGINYNGGKVGIGTSTPAWALTLEKNASGADRTFVMLNNTNTGNDATVGLTMKTGTDASDYISLGYQGPNYSLVANAAATGSVTTKNLALIANSASGKIRFITGGGIETASAEKMTITSAGNVGIGTTTPSSKLHINGTVRLQGLTSNNTLKNALVTDADGNVYTKDISTFGPWITNSNGDIGAGTTNILRNLAGTNFGYNDGWSGIHYKSSKNVVFALESEGKVSRLQLIASEGKTDKKIFAIQNSTSLTALESVTTLGYSTDDMGRVPSSGVSGDGSIGLHISSNGNVLVGKGIFDQANNVWGPNPKASLHVSAGDVYLDDATKGIIMKNASGQCYRVTVGAAGALVSTLVTCP